MPCGSQYRYGRRCFGGQPLGQALVSTSIPFLIVLVSVDAAGVRARAGSGLGAMIYPGGLDREESPRGLPRRASWT
jgi:hypothetical protein